MFEKRKMQLLQEKLDLLFIKREKLLKTGKMAEANQVLTEISEIMDKMEKITGKKYDKEVSKFDRVTTKNNQKIDKISQNIDNAFIQMGFEPTKEDNEEAERLLASLMEENNHRTK